MKISTRGRYGLRVMIELAAHYGKGPLRMSAIAKKQNVSRKYLHALLTALRSAGMVQSSRGAEGGYELARAPDTITAADIVHVLEGSTAPVECVKNRQLCKRSGTCVARQVWQDLAEAIERVLAGLNLQQLLERQQKVASGPPMFDI